LPHLYDEQDEMEKALADARGVMSHGVKTVVDPNAMNGSRDARFSKRVADETGIQIILATGIYTYEHLPMVFMNRMRTPSPRSSSTTLNRASRGPRSRPHF
jgi:phosphotriesterase-related protein